MTENNHQVYQFRVFVHGISPAIWRRLLFRNDQTLADMHYTLQIVFNWSDFYLHRFHIRGRVYSIPRICGADYHQAAQDVSLQSLQLRPKERFIYQYNFLDWWQVEIRFEKQLDCNNAKHYPVCIGGKQAGPLEDCGGPTGYLALRERKYDPFHLLIRLEEIVEEAEDDADCDAWLRHEFPDLAYWLTYYKFDRRRVNRRLKQYIAGDEAWREEQ
jgi:hypothetical protein